MLVSCLLRETEQCFVEKETKHLNLKRHCAGFFRSIPVHVFDEYKENQENVNLIICRRQACPGC